MIVAGKSTRSTDNPLVRTESGPSGTQGENGRPSALRDHLATAATLATRAVHEGLGEPVSVNVTARSCTLVLDTAGVLGWSRLLPGRPKVTTYPDSPYVLVVGSVGGVRIELHNGEAPPEALAVEETTALPSPRPRLPRAEVTV
jgi:hypothetical protein